MRRDEVDFLHIPREHQAIDLRLESWARWVKGGRRVGGACAPMFRLYRASDARSMDPQSAGVAPDEIDGLSIERAVANLPEPQREAVRWHYCFAYIGPWSVARYLGVSVADLARLTHEARAMLIESCV